MKSFVYDDSKVIGKDTILQLPWLAWLRVSGVNLGIKASSNDTRVNKRLFSMRKMKYLSCLNHKESSYALVLEWSEIDHTTRNK